MTIALKSFDDGWTFVIGNYSRAESVAKNLIARESVRVVCSDHVNLIRILLREPTSVITKLVANYLCVREIKQGTETID
jgi:hypothetical protein